MIKMLIMNHLQFYHVLSHENIKEMKIKKHQRKAFSVFKYGLNYLNNSLLNPNNMLNINCLQFCHVLRLFCLLI